MFMSGSISAKNVLYYVVSPIMTLFFYGIIGHLIFVLVQKVRKHYDKTKFFAHSDTRYIFYDIGLIILYVLLWGIINVIYGSMC